VKAQVEDIADPSQRYSIVCAVLYIEIINIFKAKVSLGRLNASLDQAANSHNDKSAFRTNRKFSSSAIPHRLTGVDLLASLNAEMNNGELKLAISRDDLSLADINNDNHFNNPEADVKKLTALVFWATRYIHIYLHKYF
jgi:hypothetical protein